MSSRFTRHGHAVRCEGDPFATCVDETAAMMVLNALRDIEERSEPLPPLQHGETRETITWGPRASGVARHVQHREQDEIACTCGLRWALDEIDPHLLHDATG